MTKQLSVEEGNRLIAEFMGRKAGRFYNPHSDWRLLMPVVEKINNKRDDGRPLTESILYWKDITNALCQTDIKQVWENVVQFIQWYQSNNQL